MATRKRSARKETKRERALRRENERLLKELARIKKQRASKKIPKGRKASDSSRRKRQREKSTRPKISKKKRPTRERTYQRNVDKHGIVRPRDTEEIAERLDLKQIEARRDERGLPPLPRSKVKGGTTTIAFAKKEPGKPGGSWRGGGQTAFRFPNDSMPSLQRASRILKKLGKRATAWQVSRSWIVYVTAPGGGKKKRAAIGFSRWRKPNESSPGSIRAALDDSQISAAKRSGIADLHYEGKAPQKITSDPANRSFILYVWWKARSRRFFIETDE